MQELTQLKELRQLELQEQALQEQEEQEQEQAQKLIYKESLLMSELN